MLLTSRREVKYGERYGERGKLRSRVLAKTGTGLFGPVRRETKERTCP